jgi:hypothetical protein
MEALIPTHSPTNTRTGIQTQPHGVNAKRRN